MKINSRALEGMLQLDVTIEITMPSNVTVLVKCFDLVFCEERGDQRSDILYSMFHAGPCQNLPHAVGQLIRDFIKVVKNLVSMVKAGTGPVRRYQQLRMERLGLDEYHLYDGSIPLVDFDKTYDWEDATKYVIESVKPLGKE